MIDNSKCKHGLKELKIKLFRELTVRNKPSEEQNKEGVEDTSKYGNEAFQSFTEEMMLIRSTFPGARSRTQVQASYEIKLSDINYDS